MTTETDTIINESAARYSIREIEVTVENTAEKFGGSLYADGQWWAYSKEEYRGPWYSPKKGDRVRLILNPWHKEDGTVKWYVKAIESLAPFTEEETRIPGKADWKEEWTFKDKDQMIWLEVLVKAAVELRISAASTGEFEVCVADVTQAVGQWKLLSDA